MADTCFHGMTASSEAISLMCQPCPRTPVRYVPGLNITPGDHLDDEISQNLEDADVIVMLISSDFVLSKAVTTWPNRDSAWVDVVGGIRSAIERRTTGSSSRSVGQQSTAPSPPTPVRSHRATLQLPRQFSDLDKHDFLEASFERIWAVLEANAAELESVNDAAKVRRVRIDAQSISIRIFVEGKELGGGSVFMGSGTMGRDQICFSFDPSVPRNSMNESFSVHVVDGELKLQPIGMLDARAGTDREEPMDADAAAEAVWNAMLKQVKPRLR